MATKGRRRSASSGAGRHVARLFCFAVVLSGIAFASSRWEIGDLLDGVFDSAGLSGVRVLARTRWDAAVARGDGESLGTARCITVHHAGGAVQRDADQASSARAIRAIQRYHQETKRWNDIAYHFVVDRGGRIWQGRPLSRMGAHAGSSAANRGNIGVLLLGNFDLQTPSTSQLDGLRRLLEAICRSRGVPRGRIFGHREIRSIEGLGATRCPGKHLEGWIEEFRRG